MKIALSILITAGIIGGVIFFLGNKNSNSADTKNATNVSVVDGKQIIEIKAKGGYSPKATSAKAEMPTILKVATNGTFDCTSTLNIPSIGYRANLPPSGTTEVEIPPQKAGSILKGLCSMGMYSFQIRFN